MYGGVSLLTLLIGNPAYMANPLYVDETPLSGVWRWIARSFVPIAAILMPLGFFLSVASQDARTPNPFIYSTYLGGLMLAIGVVVLGIGLLTSRVGRKSTSFGIAIARVSTGVLRLGSMARSRPTRPGMPRK